MNDPWKILEECRRVREENPDEALEILRELSDVPSEEMDDFDLLYGIAEAHHELDDSGFAEYLDLCRERVESDEEAAQVLTATVLWEEDLPNAHRILTEAVDRFGYTVPLAEAILEFARKKEELGWCEPAR